MHINKISSMRGGGWRKLVQVQVSCGLTFEMCRRGGPPAAPQSLPLVRLQIN
jgi:hypothetical protein